MVVDEHPGHEQVLVVAIGVQPGEDALGVLGRQPAVGGLDEDPAQVPGQHAVDRPQPLGAVGSDLADGERAGLLGVRGVGEVLEVAETQIAGDVEPPPVDAVTQVAADHRVGAVPQVVGHRRVLVDQLGQVLREHPRAGTARILLTEVEPVPVRGLRAARRLEEQRVGPAEVVEDAVQHQLQPSTVQVLGQRGDVGPGAVPGRDLQVVDRVVAVVGVGGADRVEIEDVDAETHHVVQPRAKARQVTTPEVDLVAVDPHLLHISSP